MTELARHLIHYRSPIDGQDLPLVVCAPAGSAAAGEWPLVFWLHDTLSTPTAESFVEDALRVATRWMPAWSAAPAAVWAIPFGRGNAGWLGAGGRDLFDGWDEIRRRFAIRDRAAIGGIGAGATGALQLACWFPHRFSAVAAVGAWSDWQLDLPLGAKQWPAWELSQRRAISPKSLARNLGSLSIHLGHPWWFDGSEATARRAHADALISALNKQKVSFAFSESMDGIKRECPADAAALFAWLATSVSADQPVSLRFKTYSLRSDRARGVRLLQLAAPGRPATVEIKGAAGRRRLKTKGVDAMSLSLADLGEPSPTVVRVDGQDLSLASNGSAHGWIQLERIGRAWEALSHDDADAAGNRRPALAGPAMDMRWDGVTFVHGTLGAEADNHAMRGFARDLKAAWETGADSSNPHPGDRRPAIVYPLCPDVEVDASIASQRHLVVVGNPRSNLLLARMRGLVPCHWEDAATRTPATRTASFTIAGRTYRDPRDVAFVVCENPEHPRRYVMMVTANDVGALNLARRVNTAFLPDYLVHRAERVLDWGYFGAEWRPVG